MKNFKFLLIGLFLWATPAMAVDVTVVDGLPAMAVDIYDPSGVADDSFDYANHFGNLDTAAIPNFDSAIGEVQSITGIDSHGIEEGSCKPTVNVGDDSLIDIAECHFHLKGPAKEHTATTFDPGFEAGENSLFVAATMTGYTTATSAWTSDQKRTLIPIARLNTPLGELGPGSTIGLIRDDRYFLFERDALDRRYLEEVFGARYVSGGDVFENATTGLVLGQNAGILYDGQTKRHELAAFGNTSAIFLHLSSNETDWISERKPFVIDNVNYNPPGSGIVPLLNDNKIKADTILKSPKGANGTQEGGLFVVYGTEQFDTAAGAEAAGVDFSFFINTATSGIVANSLVIQQKNQANVTEIIDKRPCFVCRP